MVIALYRYLLFQLEKKGGGTKFFKGGPIFSENIGSPGPFIWSGGTVFDIHALPNEKAPMKSMNTNYRL